MDTKSKKYSHSFAVRLIAVTLFAVLTLTNSFFIAKAVRGLILFGATAATSAAEPVTHTAAFAAATQELIDMLCDTVNRKAQSAEEYIAEKRAEIDLQYADRIATYNEIISDYNTCVLLEAGEELASTVREPLTTAPVVPQTSAAGENVTLPESVTTRQQHTELETALETFVYVNHDYDSGEESQRVFLKRGDTGFWYYQFKLRGYGNIEDFARQESGYGNYLDAVNSLERFLESDYCKEYFAEIDSADFYIIDRKTGNYYSNIGCTTEKEAATALKGSAWYSFFTNSTFETNDTRKYTLGSRMNNIIYMPGFSFNYDMYNYNGIPCESDFSVASPYYWFVDRLGLHSDIANVENDFAIYIGFDGKFDGADNFANINSEYENYRTVKLLPVGIMALLCLILMIAVAASTGKDEENKPKKYFIDKLWNDIHFVLSFSLISGIAVLVVGFAAEFTRITLYNPTAFAAVCATGFTLCVLLLLEWFTSVVRHVRMKTFLKHTLCAKLLVLLWQFIKFFFTPVRWAFRSIRDLTGIKHLPRWIVAACIGVIVVNFALVGMSYGLSSFFPIFLLLWLDACVIAIFLWVFISLDKIMKAVEDTKSGRLNKKLDVSKIFPLLRDFAQNVNMVGNGLQAAVNSALKDQQMKAELITNVSHDLKTPLTSIVSYVDLLKRCEVEDEQARKYIDILDEKSLRMKKLIEDLVEASKVSSGAVELHPMKLNLCELAVQAVGENSEILEKSGIELRYRVPEQPVYIMADGQKTSRIIENLFSNVQKYAMPESRVYAEVLTDGKFGALTIKNVSRYPLDISAAELTQRFVRGDAARSSEGSGLGLSIAQNLCELQGGKCIIYIDGDLFKVTILLPMA